MKPAIFCWSGGKDSAYALNKVISEQLYDVRYLLTTVNAQHKRISMHGVREGLLQQQVASIGIPLLTVYVSEGTNEEYERRMEEVLLQAKADGIQYAIFGDIFLEDLRAYREQNLAKVGMTGVFPLWNLNTETIITDFISMGFKTIICCTNDAYMGEEWAGREIDTDALAQLPAGVDPCGENGEYHTFCHAGPIFKNEVSFITGHKVYMPLEVKTTDCDLNAKRVTKGFWFCDLVPG